MSAEPTLFERLIAAREHGYDGRRAQMEMDRLLAEERRTEWAARAIAGAIILVCIGGAAWLTM